MLLSYLYIIDYVFGRWTTTVLGNCLNPRRGIRSKRRWEIWLVEMIFVPNFSFVDFIYFHSIQKHILYCKSDRVIEKNLTSNSSIKAAL